MKNKTPLILDDDFTVRRILPAIHFLRLPHPNRDAALEEALRNGAERGLDFAGFIDEAREVVDHRGVRLYEYTAECEGGRLTPL